MSNITAALLVVEGRVWMPVLAAGSSKAVAATGVLMALAS